MESLKTKTVFTELKIQSLFVIFYSDKNCIRVYAVFDLEKDKSTLTTFIKVTF